MRSLALALGLSIVVTGCETYVTGTQLNAAPRPTVARGFECVEVFSSAAPTRPHVDVALVEVQQTNELDEHPIDLMIQRLREQAGRRGCDAVFIGGQQEVIAANPLSTGVRKLQATCIVYNEPLACTPGPGIRAHDGNPRRMCADRRDFDAHRNCVLPLGAS